MNAPKKTKASLVARFCLHQFLAVASWLAVAAIYGYSLGIIEAFARQPVRALQDSCVVNSVLALGIVGVGYFMGMRDPHSVVMAGCACMAPLTLLLWVVISHDRRFGFQSTIDTYFYGRAALGLGLLFTAPFASSLLYWLGTAVGRFFRGPHRETETLEATNV